MTDQLYLIGKNSPAALNRYIYYPDHIVRLPGPDPNGGGSLSTIARGLMALATEPLFEGVLMGILREPLPDPPKDRKDESVASFISRRLGPKVADNLVSAVFHGIFAGDVYKLSAHTLLGREVAIERKHESLWIGYVQNSNDKTRMIPADHLLAAWSVSGQRPPGYFDRLRGMLSPVSVFTLKDGIAAIARGIDKNFEKHSHKIRVVTDANIGGIKREENHDITVGSDSDGNKRALVLAVKLMLTSYADITDER